MITNLEDQLQAFFRNYSVNLTDYLKSQLKIASFNPDRDNNYKEWFKTGKECEILKQGQNWQKGKVKVQLKIEYIPDKSEALEENGYPETESPLDEIRQQLTEENPS